jgi:2-polyprenyl-3-methyl-5-hydroxy-6-metoxy-1,4-benzoquinol methylase
MNRRFDSSQHEFMDDPATPRHELAQAIDELAIMNRRFGSHRLLRRFLERWLNPGRCYRILDFCAGAGDLPRAMARWAREREITLRIDAVDKNPVIVELAKERSADFPEIHYQVGNALLDTPGDGYDLVHCALSLHHFSDADAARVLIRCGELSNRWVLVSDLERSPLTTAAVWGLTTFFQRGRVTAHDGRVSAQRAFSYHEMRQLAVAAGWQNFGHSRFLWCRQALWLENRDLGDIPLVVAEVPSLA